ncbi:MAG: hypothetical protein GY926_23250 [bacterium]|nr:hypothetical protein [bacterium]
MSARRLAALALTWQMVLAGCGLVVIGPDDHLGVTEVGTLAGGVENGDHVLAIDVTARNAVDQWVEIDAVRLYGTDEPHSQPRLGDAFDTEGNKIPKCGLGTCLWIHMACVEDLCTSRTLLPIPSDLGGTGEIDWEVVATIDQPRSNTRLEVEANAIPVTDLELPTDWELPGDNVIFARGRLIAFRQSTAWKAELDVEHDGSLSDLQVLVEAPEVADHPDVELQIFDAQGNQVQTSPRPYRAYNEADSIEHLFEQIRDTRWQATVYLVASESLQPSAEIIAGLVIIDPDGRPIPQQTTGSVGLGRLLDTPLPFDLP